MAFDRYTPESVSSLQDRQLQRPRLLGNCFDGLRPTQPPASARRLGAFRTKRAISSSDSDSQRPSAQSSRNGAFLRPWRDERGVVWGAGGRFNLSALLSRPLKGIMASGRLTNLDMWRK